MEDFEESLKLYSNLIMPHEFELMMQNQNRLLQQRQQSVNKSFAKQSFENWQELRKGTSKEFKGTLCGEFNDKFYGKEASHGIDIPQLINFIAHYNGTGGKIFNWDDYDTKPTYENDLAINSTVPLQRMLTNNEFENINPEIWLNKRVCFLDQFKRWSFTSKISNPSIYLELDIYYEDSYAHREYSNDKKFEIDDKYIAIKFRSANIEHMLFIITMIYGSSESAYVKNSFTKKYYEILKATTDSDFLNVLYKRMPNFVAAYIKEKYTAAETIPATKHNLPDTAADKLNRQADFDSRTAIADIKHKHLAILTKADNSSPIDDYSKAILKLLQTIPNDQLYLFLKDNPIQVKEIFYNLDGSSNVFDAKTQQLNKMNFVQMLLALFMQNKFSGFSYKLQQPHTIDTFKIGGNY